MPIKNKKVNQIVVENKTIKNIFYTLIKINFLLILRTKYYFINLT